MVSLLRQKDYRAAQRLPFCYLCGKTFLPGDEKNRDHLPAQCIFLPEDREPLWLPTHIACNSGESVVDERMGQLIALRYGKAPSDPANKRLDITIFADARAAVTNLSIDAVVWRWVRGFHAGLYGSFLPRPGPDFRGALVTPFPRASASPAGPVIEPLLPQHSLIVQTIKLNRLKSNLDRIVANKGKLVYECVWCQADGNGPWMCMFALNLYDWKDLGAVEGHPARGCAGFYTLADGGFPPGATTGMNSPIIIPNIDKLDPFAA